MLLAASNPAQIYSWNMLPVGQQLRLRELESCIEFPALQDPASYNLVQVIDQIRKMANKNPSR